MLKEKLKQELKYTPHLLVDTRRECRVYNNCKDYYVEITDVDTTLPVLVSLRRLTKEPHDYGIYRQVERVVSQYNQEFRTELTLCG